MKDRVTTRMPEKLIERAEVICKKEGGRSLSSFVVEATTKLVTEKETNHE